MKRFFYLTLICLLALTTAVQANDFLEHKEHYLAYSAGQDKVHFKIPIFSRGGYNYYSADVDGHKPYLFYKLNGTQYEICSFGGGRYEPNNDDDDPRGEAWVKMVDGTGLVEVTNIYNGGRQVVPSDGSSHSYYVKKEREAGNDDDYVTWLEVDWYPPLDLAGDTFHVGVNASFCRAYNRSWAYHFVWVLAEDIRGDSTIMQPQLSDPYFYAVNENGITGFGLAAIPYMVFNDPKEYRTSLDTVWYRTSDRAGSLYVMTNDTVQEHFQATFNLFKTKNPDMMMQLPSNTVDIPPYHRIYDLRATEEKDSTGTYTGNNILRWEIKNPLLHDLVESDYFEIQRAFKADYSDARQIDIVSMRRDTNGIYTYQDDSRDTWTGRASSDSNAIYMQVSDDHYILNDEEGNPIADLDVTLINTQVKHPAVPVFYRIRRASSSIWGWVEEFSRKVRMSKHNYLAPLADNQPDYTLDPQFDKNRMIHFNILLNNEEVPVPELKKEDCRLEYDINTYYRQDTAELTIAFSSADGIRKAEDVTLIQITDADNRVILPWGKVAAGSYLYPVGSKISVKSGDSSVPAPQSVYTFVLEGMSTLTGKVMKDVVTGYEFGVSFERTGIGLINYVEQYREAITDSMFTVMQSEQDTVPGRCMWDRTARLILMRTILETGTTTELIIPQDSIVRLSDGSWAAHYTDVADQACAHYRYAVRIDQSAADLHVLDSASLAPRVINGPNLYFDDAATITSFTATQGAASGQQKRGVLLSWIPSSTAVDQYVLTRLMDGSDGSADTIYTGIENNFFDETALPSIHYEYVITALYECNGKSSANSATAEGWRTPYGEISGSILMPDNSGMAGVDVALQDASGTVIRTITTGSDGSYLFDSLQYYVVECHYTPQVKIRYSHYAQVQDPSPYVRIRILNPDGSVKKDWGKVNAGTYEYEIGTKIEVKTTEENNENKDKVYSATVAADCELVCENRAHTLGEMHWVPSFVLTVNGNKDFVPCRTVKESESYVVIPTHTYAQFSYNSTSAGTAAITLSADNAAVGRVNFMNTTTARLTGRALYENTTIPVAGAMFLLNGDTVRRNGIPVTTGTDGNFIMELTQGQPYTLQIFKPGHTFALNGYFQMEEGKDTFAIDKPLDAIRFYDQTKVRLVGRVAGGIDQRDLPEAFGLGTNNLGDNLQLVLQLEGDNVAHFVHDPNDLLRDTVQQDLDHIVWQTANSQEPTAKIVGTTHTLFEKKRVIIHPDPLTGEYEVDLFPVKYKVMQATATGYATLFASGAGLETFDLTNAPLENYDPVIGEDSVHYNAVYDRIYRSPVQVHLTQLMYGVEQEGYGEKSMNANGYDPSGAEKLQLFTVALDGTVTYTLGHPVFLYNRKYQFEASAYESYYYNNVPEGSVDRVPQRGGRVTIHNGMHTSTETETYELDSVGKNRNVWLTVDHIQPYTYGEDALSTVTIALEQEGNTVETDAFTAFVAGDEVYAGELTAADADIVLLDIIRDPGGNGSSAWVESGTTYTFSATDSYTLKVGLEITAKYGLNVSNDIGNITAPQGVGAYIGGNFTTSKQFSLPLPITHQWSWGTKYEYSFTTTDRISTSSQNELPYIGSNADVFVGAMRSQITGKAKSIGIINDTLFQARQPAIQAGTMHVLAQGTDAAGKPYYLVTGEKVVLGSTINNTFVYSQYYIMENVIPQLLRQRDNLLSTYPDSITAQAAADASGEAVYWYIDSLTALNLHGALAEGSYHMFVPSTSTKAYINQVAALDNIILKWLTIIIQNEKEKVMARQSGQYVGTYSVSDGNNFSHTDSYTATANYNELPQGGSLIGKDALKAGGNIVQSVLFQALNKELKAFGGNAARFGTSIEKALEMIENDVDADGNVIAPKNEQELGTVTNTSRWTFSLNPVLDFDHDSRTSVDRVEQKSAGFTIVPDYQGDITISVYRASLDSIWDSETGAIREQAGADEYFRYGSYVFYTEAGSTYCAHEKEEKTRFYNEGTVINNGTMMVAVPEMGIDRYEVSGVPSDQRAVLHLQLKNEGQVQYGVAAIGTNFLLSLLPETNPHGAKVYANGVPLTMGVEYYMIPGQTFDQVIEVERGEVDDYEDLGLYFNVKDCPKTYSTLNFSVHFTPESSPVSIEAPRQNWTMNTLSPHDSVGYYLPIDISGFNIHHKNFDHIEFQYKLSTQSDDNWVNQCSFYANDSLYELASGNKAMIENGRILPFRFYGERDPMEQRYDLRAVSFCRYGSGFVTKASPVISGIKDTRPPVVFGEPEPANAILGVGDNLQLRFNEPIAGNYLDEDNNFQITGITNATGFSASTSLHFDGNSSAATKVKRDLTDKSFTIDMMIRPSEANNRANDMILFETGNGQALKRLILTKDNRLRLVNIVGNITLGRTSKPIGDILSFVRVACVYEKGGKTRFYAGTEDITDRTFGGTEEALTGEERSAYFLFGSTYEGDMLETRVWTKGLTAEEIAATNGHTLTGYERELLAYYRMDEGKGESVTDHAHGATLYLEGCSWNKQQGFSLHLNDTSEVKLDGNLLARSAVYDETMMFWFKPESNGTIFRADSFSIDLEAGKLVLRSKDKSYIVNRQIVNNEWSHFVLTVNRAYNSAAIFVDGNLYQSFNAVELNGITGAMYLGGNGFQGNIDEFVIFEQALPKPLVELYENIALTGDEMGLVAYLPFEEQFLNANGVLELRFSGNDRRVYKNPETGEVIDQVVPLIIDQPSMDDITDPAENAPIQSHGLLNKLYFNWSFNSDELMINILNRDYEVNKQSVYVTVRDVEDLNGNPMVSPVTWTAFVDRNSLKWSEKQVDMTVEDNQQSAITNYQLSIINHSGKRHTYTIESLPSWLTVDAESGALDPLAQKTVRLSFNAEMPVGEYSDIIYLTDEDGLSEPLQVSFNVEAVAPYDGVEEGKYPYNMSVCAQVKIAAADGVSYDFDERDIVYALYRNECVGSANVSVNPVSNTTEVYLTVHGQDAMNRKPIHFQLWQASTGKIFDLTANRNVLFSHGFVYGCGEEEPLILTTGGSERQQIALHAGWNWASVNLDLTKSKGELNACITAAQPWTEGDLIKNPSSRQFSTYAQTEDAFIGTLSGLHFSQIYMIYTANGNTMRVSGEQLAEDSMRISVRGDGQWSPLPCLFDQRISVTEALADYYQNASVGDIIKAHNRFATFSADRRWVGDLQALQPGEGYLFRRLAPSTETITFYKPKASSSPARITSLSSTTTFTNPAAATNMTMISKIANGALTGPTTNDQSPIIRVYVNNELAAVASPITIINEQSPMSNDEVFYFITIQSDQLGELRFECENGEQLTIINEQSPMSNEQSPIVPSYMEYVPDAHYGTLKSPVILRPAEETGVYKIIEENHVVIIRNNERYDVTGKKL